MDLGPTKLVNLAFRVPRVSEAEGVVETAAGWSKRAMHSINGEAFLEAAFGDVRINFFETAIYDDEASTAQSGFLHASFAVPDLDAVLADADWRSKLVWGPAVIEGGFGRRRIAFFEPIPSCRIELMEQISD